MKKKEILLPLGILVCTMAVLIGTAAILKPMKTENIQQEQLEVMRMLLPDSETFTQETYEGEDANITRVFKSENGYVIETNVEGYVDDMTLWVGVDNNGTVTGVTVRDMAETWGLGSRAMTDMTFLSQFLDGTGDASIGENVDALAGATVSSKSVAKAVNSAAAFVTGADVTSQATEWGG